MDSDTRFSNILSKALDSLGYSYSAIKKRIDLYTATYTDNDTVNGTDYNMFIVGSKREGVSLPLESDHDFMYVLNNFICFDDVQMSIHPNFTLKLIRDDSPPGYTKLKLENGSDSIDISDPDIGTEIHEHVGGHKYLSSDKMIEEIITVKDGSKNDLIQIDYKCRAGPSCPMELTTNSIVGVRVQCDFVCALPCICSDYLSAWCSRERYQGFPSEQTIHEVSQMEAHAVPVGYKGCDDQRLQWRICYTLAEIKLIQSFNAAQFQLYVSLKMIAKTVLKPICSEITSYVIKNVVLWILEITPSEQFTTDHLSRLIAKSLLFLKIVINENYIPNYMIPIRNLLAEKMLLSTKNKLMKALCSLHDKGGSVMLVCPEVSKEVVILHNNSKLYFTRKSNRENYIELILKQQLVFMKLLSQKFKSVHELTEGFLETIPIDMVRKKLDMEMSICADNSELFQIQVLLVIKEILKSQSLQELFIRILTECGLYLSNDCGSVTLATIVSKNDVEQLVLKYTEPLDDAYSEEMIPHGRVVGPVNREFLSEYIQLFCNSLMRTVLEKPEFLGELFKKIIEKDFFATISDDVLKLINREFFRFASFEDRQILSTNPEYLNFFTKLLSGKSI